MAATDAFSLGAEEVDLPFSILDTDLYKLTMQNAVLKHFYDSQVIIRFTNRAPQMRFTRECFDWIQAGVNRLGELRLKPEERKRLQEACPYFPDSYLDFLTNIRLTPKEQVRLTFIAGEDGLGEIACEIEGPWRETILYEVPIMAIISEGYFKFVDTDWSTDGQYELAKQKAHALLSPPAPVKSLIFSEFGTRRRRSFAVHDLVMRGLIAGHDEWKAAGGQGGALTGTSNVYLALKYGVKPSGTIAHEWIMAIGATYGYTGANGRAMDMWEEIYPANSNGPPLIMLTDTYTASVFFKDFLSDPARALRWSALRQDSGDPFVFVTEAKAVWEDVAKLVGSSGDALEGKRIVFSDSLDVKRAIDLQRGCDDIGMGAAFGIGTFFTNDFKKKSDPSQQSKALNMVIKLNVIDGKDCVKLSDDKGKHTGKAEEVVRAKEELGLAL
ncbi:nicotinate phosphoribosyltransferase [Vanrija albida]|uniref:Nicotinate phosphoribosyltransferase n=1 Tax=Vanrija albida TaxID=181172 RepID=A0ABR3QE18_9TREE